MLERLKLGVSERKILKINKKRWLIVWTNIWILRCLWYVLGAADQNEMFWKNKKDCYDLESLFDIHDIPNCTYNYYVITSQTKQLIVQIHDIVWVLDALWGQPINLIQVVSISEFHEYWWNNLDFIFFVPSTCCGASEVQT